MDIARVTDYIIAYCCKGSYTFKEEAEINKQIILKAEEVTGDRRDIQRLCKQIMNKASTSRLISKQECMVLLGRLNLAKCSETLENVSISQTERLRQNKDETAPKTMVKQYQQRQAHLEHLSLYEFYHLKKNGGNKCSKNAKIPYFVGVSGTPKYPITPSYARHVLTVHKPWKTYPNHTDWIKEFQRFIVDPNCPQSALMTYNRVLSQFYTNTMHHEPKAHEADHSKIPLSVQTKICLI